MKIQNVSTQNFGIKKLYCANLARQNAPEGKNRTQVFVSELELSDLEEMKKRRKMWENSTYGANIIIFFEMESEKRKDLIGKDVRFFVIESPDYKYPKDIKALCYTEFDKKEMSVAMLQTERQINPKKTLRGLGSCMLYGVVKAAQERGKKEVTLDTVESSEKFYEKIGFVKPVPCSYKAVLPKLKFDKFLKMMEEKYFITKC